MSTEKLNYRERIKRLLPAGYAQQFGHDDHAPDHPLRPPAGPADRPGSPADQDIRATPYRELHDTDKQHLVALLATEHQRHEAIRFAPVCEEDVLIRVNVALLMTAMRELESRRKLI